MDGLVHPDFSRMGEVVFWKAVMIIAIIASLETLLSAGAVDKLDPYHRKTNLNRDLTAVGLGTSISGMLGGLPMIAEIVRSSANVNNGAKTRWANFFHGLFMLTFVSLAPGLIHRIPLASLAAILCYTGFRLASPKEFRKTYALGSDQLLIFVTTVLVTLATDLLIGIFSGVLVKFCLHLIRGVGPAQMVRCQVDLKVDEEIAHCSCSGALTFGRFAGREVVFLARHGYGHTIAPHEINYRANVWALKELQVEGIIAVATVGGVREAYGPGSLVVPDQIIDYTHGRQSTFFGGGGGAVVHVDFTRPYTDRLRRLLLAASSRCGEPVFDGGVYACTQGPRLETAAEIERIARDGGDLVGMTGMPEAVLAREAELDYATLCVVVNHAAGRGSSAQKIELTELDAMMQTTVRRAVCVLQSAIGDLDAGAP